MASRETPKNGKSRLGSGSKTNIIAVDESAASIVDFDISQSRLSVGGLFDKGPDTSHSEQKPFNLTKQGTETSMPSAIKAKDNHNQTLNKSGTFNRSTGGPEDDLGMTLDDADLILSQSDFSTSMISGKLGIGAFVSNPSS